MNDRYTKTQLLLGKLASFFLKKESTILYEQLYQSTGIDDKKLTPLVFTSLSTTLLESVRSLVFGDKFLTVLADDWDYIDSIIADNSPRICLTGHIGNWELFASLMVKRGAVLTVIGKDIKNPIFNFLISKIRTNGKFKTIWRLGRAGLKEIITDLKNKRIIAALIDQDTAVSSIHVPFFGAPAKTPVSLIRLAKKENARIVVAFMTREKSRIYKVHVKDIDPQLSEEDILTQYNKELSDIILKYPEQWVWFHKRWRTSLNGHTMRTREYISFLKDNGLKKLKNSHEIL